MPKLKDHPLSVRGGRRTTAEMGLGSGGPPGAGGGGPGDDPGWQRPKDPLNNVKATARVISREIPISSTSTSWTVADVRSALLQLTLGLFDEPAQLVDALFTASRVQAAMGSRTGGLLGRQVDFVIPKAYRDSDAAAECATAIDEAWEEIGGEEQLAEVDSWGIMLGFAPGQLLWEFDREYATPHMALWHPRYTYWHVLDRRFIAIGLDGQERIEPGDGHWFLHAPKGAYRGWMRSAMRAIAEPWLARAYGRRDWSRYSERHGFPVIKAYTPSDADPEDTDRFRESLSELGQESTVELPRGANETESYDLDYLETKDDAWDAFRALIDSCDAEITLAIMSQNLTTEVKEGSYAAARVHADVRQALLEADARSLGRTLYRDVLRPFAALNFGNPDLAPMPRWDLKPYEDDLTAAQTLLAFAQALERLATAGWGIDNPERFAKSFGIDMRSVKFLKRDPIKVGLGA